MINHNLAIWHLQAPGHHLMDVTVGVFKINSSVVAS